MPWPKGKPRSEETKKKLSKVSSSSRSEVRAKMSATRKGKNTGVDNHMYGKTHSDETKLEMSKNRSGELNPRYGICLDDETREKISNTLKNKHFHTSEKQKAILKKVNTGNQYRLGIPHTDETKRKLSISSTGRKHTEETKELIRASTIELNKRMGNKNTSIELELQQELLNRGVKFETNVPLENCTLVDIFVDPDIAIYADGDYWHNLPERIIKDKIINEKLLKAGYKVYRFWEHEIHEDVGACIDKVIINNLK